MLDEWYESRINIVDVRTYVVFLHNYLFIPINSNNNLFYDVHYSSVRSFSWFSTAAYLLRLWRSMLSNTRNIYYYSSWKQKKAKALNKFVFLCDKFLVRRALSSFSLFERISAPRFFFSPKSNKTLEAGRDWGRNGGGFFYSGIIPRCCWRKKRSAKRSCKNANNELRRYPTFVALASDARCSTKDKSPEPRPNEYTWESNSVSTKRSLKDTPVVRRSCRPFSGCCHT